MSNETSTIGQQIVIYKGIKCEVIYNYGNGNYEIVFGEQILLVQESEIQFLN
ncbi:hypothetical protein [Metabacillus niabensis]|uniref:hypothetical protein n=1 Tax=Metabacillus niabensis TaxID=324854 RepID=UPI001CF9EFAA|nr:hypothetical protein [Metabacillus niabensis]